MLLLSCSSRGRSVLLFSPRKTTLSSLVSTRVVTKFLFRYQYVLPPSARQTCTALILRLEPEIHSTLFPVYLFIFLTRTGTGFSAKKRTLRFSKTMLAVIVRMWTFSLPLCVAFTDDLSSCSLTLILDYRDSCFVLGYLSWNPQPKCDGFSKFFFLFIILL